MQINGSDLPGMVSGKLVPRPFRVAWMVAGTLAPAAVMTEDSNYCDFVQQGNLPKPCTVVYANVVNTALDR